MGVNMKYFIDTFEAKSREDFLDHLMWIVERDVKKDLRDKLNSHSFAFMNKGYGQAYVWSLLDPEGYQKEEDAAVKRYATNMLEELEQVAEKEGKATTDYRLYEIKVEK
jgi:hypothetical protein